MSKLDKKNVKTSTSDFTASFAEESRKLGDRLREVWEKSGLKQDEFASRLGITPVTLQNYFKNIRLPNSEFIKQTCVEFSLSPEWLLWGVEQAGSEKRNSREQTQDRTWMAPEAAPELGFTLVPKVRARLAAGTGSLETEGDIVGYYSFKTDFLMRKGKPSRMVLMDVIGDSMDPEIKEGDSVLIDESQTEIFSGGIFAVAVDHEAFIKYLDRIPGKLVLRSRNERYASIEVDMVGDLADQVRIIGRVVWSCREYVR